MERKGYVNIGYRLADEKGMLLFDGIIALQGEGPFKVVPSICDATKDPILATTPVDKGMIERRNEYLNILINDSKKVVGILTDDEHNNNWLKLPPQIAIYPENYVHKKLNVSRSIFQINNGAAGDPYYGQEILSWSKHTQSFSVENTLCLFYVDADNITMKVYNPDILNLIDEMKLR
ncbi:hypothetical protein [Gelidibacter salicanalis]|uniref:Uncharacterized protein n=1 Tax=Gelidibacter salicanalis TaxID=291193 RepID=A0A934NKC9_9FLAO|nr:hypothetical protein [Gelidibacter salicanalis]MBJ7879932.1 hypothetical protein [Gelidibacter salicanalis]